MILDSTSGTGNFTYTYSGAALRPPQRFIFSNDGSADATLTINGIAFTVKGGEQLEESISPFTVAAISGSPGAWRLIVGR